MAVTDKYAGIIKYLTLTGSIFIALSVNMGGLLSGRIATFLSPLQKESPWLFLLYPLLLTARGNIGGILSSKLGTELHLGSISPSFLNNTERFNQLLSLFFSLSLLNAFIISVIASVYGYLFGIPIDFLLLLVLCVSFFVFSFLIGGGMTLGLSFLVFRNKKDPDTIVYPIMSTVNDILVSVFIIVFYQFYNTPARLRIYFVGLPLTLISVTGLIFFLWKYKHGVLFKQSLQQALPVITMTTLIAALTGTVLSSFDQVLHQNIVLLIVYPAILCTVGDQGSIMVNTTTTKLHLGSIEANFSSFRNRAMVILISSVITVGILLNGIYTFLGLALASASVTIGYVRLLSVLVLTNVLSFLILGAGGLYVAITSYKVGLDPDNIVMPIQSSVADLIVTLNFIMLATLLL